jgi:hypothetical protein
LVNKDNFCPFLLSFSQYFREFPQKLVTTVSGVSGIWHPVSLLHDVGISTVANFPDDVILAILLLLTSLLLSSLM